MPPPGVKSPKRKRQYEHIKDSALEQGRSPARAKQIAAATVNKQRAEAGQTKSAGGRKKAAGGRKKAAGGRKKAAGASRRASPAKGRKKTAAKKR